MRTRTHSTHTNLTSLMAATAAAAAAAAGAATGSNKEVKDSLATHDSGGSVNEKREREREGGRDVAICNARACHFYNLRCKSEVNLSTEISHSSED